MYNYLSDVDQARLNRYSLYSKIYEGDHYDAFNILSKDFSHDYAMLRYVVANFGGLMSRVSADLLFEEFPSIQLVGGDNEFLTEVFDQNKLKTQLYESGQEQSYNGDVVLRIRAEGGQVVVEDINPCYYFPEYNKNNVRSEPKTHTLQWETTIQKGGKDRKALFKEIHKRGEIIYELWEIEDNGTLGEKLIVGEYLKTADGKPYPEKVETGVNEFLLIHIPNRRTNRHFFGISDYKDLIPLFFALNNRITKIDNILDKHGEPILTVPPGVLDENGKVKRESFGVIEVDTQEAQGGKPEYIVWDAKLDSAFKQIEQMVELLYILGDMSPALFGMDKGGQAESGRALKFRLLRTIAKKHAKELYYDVGLKELVYTIQLFAKANNLKAGDLAIKKEPVKPVITWKDGVINDAVEQLDIEERRVSAGLQDEVTAIANLDGTTEQEAQKKHEKIKKEKEEKAPQFNANPLFNKNQPPNQPPVDNKNNAK